LEDFIYFSMLQSTYIPSRSDFTPLTNEPQLRLI